LRDALPISDHLDLVRIAVEPEFVDRDLGDRLVVAGDEIEGPFGAGGDRRGHRRHTRAASGACCLPNRPRNTGQMSRLSCTSRIAKVSLGMRRYAADSVETREPASQTSMYA